MIQFQDITIIFEIISAIIIFISYLFETIQSFNNYNFRKNRTKADILERSLFDHFYSEIFINENFLYTKTNNYKYTYNNIGYLIINVNLDSYYDCSGVQDEELNEQYCQNKIISNNTCCRPECCSINLGNVIYCNNYTFNSNNNIIDHHKTLYYNDEEFLEDPRRKFCTYFNSYTSWITHKYLSEQNLYRFKDNYIDLLLKSNNDSNAYIGEKNIGKDRFDCGIIDTYNNHLFLNVEDKDSCPINKIIRKGNNYIFENINDNNNNNSKLIVKCILSEIQPSIHEFDYSQILSIHDYLPSLNLREINEEINNEKIYQTQEAYVNAKELSGYFYFDDQTKNANEKLNLYSTNYIGFKEAKDYRNFKHYLDNYRNPILRIGTEIYPSVESIVIGFILMALSLTYIVLLFLSLFNKFENLKQKIIYFFIIKQILFVLTFGEELGIYIWMIDDFPEINIEMDKNYKKILNLYNKRRFQLLLLLSIIFLGISEVITIIGLFFSKNKIRNNNAVNSENNNEIHNEHNNNRIPFQNPDQPINSENVVLNSERSVNARNSQNNRENINLLTLPQNRNP